METNGITTAELEAALGGLYTAPKDPDAPDFADEPDPTPVDELPLPATARRFTVADMEATLGDMYTAPSLEEAA
ncbi:MAG TPA: hypothetical protein VFV09_12510 [Actinomycetota bacterium]|jgi:hypothetical protein|nr:hypothetical protein [Actinomycetota bacterium]